MNTPRPTSTIRRPSWWRFAVLCKACVVAAVVSPAAIGAPPEISASDWKSIRAAHETSRHAAFAIKGGYQTRNPGQQWVTTFDGRGFTSRPDRASWQWGLELQAYGFGSRLRRIDHSRVKAEGSRVTYAWDELLEEWFVNDQRGLEHGFTVAQRPASEKDFAGPLVIDLIVRGPLRTEVEDDGLGARFLDEKGAAAVIYSGLKVWDADGHAVPARLENSPATGMRGLRISVDERGARYPLTIDPVAHQAVLLASNADENDRFGTSVAISGNTVVVGAPLEDSAATGINGDQADNSAPGAGAAYVFVRTGATWAQQAYLKASNAEAFDAFGTSVAISGGTIAVGAPGEAGGGAGTNGDEADNEASGAGAVYTFTRIGATWTQEAYVKASNPDAGDGFGFAVSLSPTDLLVGAPDEDSAAIGINGDQADNNAPGAGAAYVFVRSEATWAQQAYFKATNTDAFDQFGWAVSIAGALDGQALIGAPGESSNATGTDGLATDNSAPGSGAAYIYRFFGDEWEPAAYLKASNSGQQDGFGYAVSLSGSSQEFAVVGAPFEDSDATGVGGDQGNDRAEDSGAAYFYSGKSGVWQQEVYVKASNAGAGDRFGRAVAVHRASREAGYGEALVGAPGEDSNATGVNGDQTLNGSLNSGAAYAFARVVVNGAEVWTQEAYLKATVRGAGFGEAVAIGGELDGADGTGNFLVGSPLEGSVPFRAGAAHVFMRSPRSYFSIPDADGPDVQFGAIPVGDSAARKIHVGNNGPTNVVVTRISLSPLPGLAFAVSKKGGGAVTFPHTIPSGSSSEGLEIDVQWTPAAIGTLSAFLNVAATDGMPGSSSFSYTVSGSSISPVARAFEQTIVGFQEEVAANAPGSAALASPVRRGIRPLGAGPVGDVQTATLVVDPTSTNSLTAEVPAFLGGGSVQLGNFTGRVTVSLAAMPNDPDRRLLRIESGSLTAPSVQLPSGLNTGPNRLTFGPPEQSGGVLLLATGSYTTFATAMIVNDLIPNGVSLQGSYSGVYDLQSGRISAQSQSADLFQRNDLLHLQRSATGAQVTWSGPGTLEQTTDLLGEWTPLPGAISPHAVDIAQHPRVFFRLRLPESPAPAALASETIRSSAVVTMSDDSPVVTPVVPLVSEPTFRARVETGPIIAWPRTAGGNNHSYQAIAAPEGIAWADAQVHAIALGGKLATISSVEENRFVFSLVDDPKYWTTNPPRNDVNLGPWLGGFKTGASTRPSEGWQWVDRSDFTYNDWRPRQPDNHSQHDDRLHFLGGPGTRQAGWGDLEGIRRLKGFVVEYPTAVDARPVVRPEPAGQ